MAPGRIPGPATRRGIALIAVLWVCALVSVLAAGFAYALRNEAQLNAAVVDRARAGAAAEAGLQRILTLLRSSRAGTQTRSPLREYSLTFDTLKVRAEVAAEAGKIDLNAAPASLVHGLLQRAAVTLESLDGDRARALADAILDWRDADGRTRAHGAERREYRALGLAGPRDQPFMSVGELRQVAGMTRDVFEFLAPLVSVDSLSARIDPRAAARDTLLAVPGLDPAQVDAYLAGRAAGGGTGASVSLLKSSKYLLIPNRARAYTITVTARTRGGVRALRRAVVRLNRTAAAPIAILSWSRFRQGAVPAAAGPGGVI